MFVKICGVRDVETARGVADCGPDAIGLNFYRGSSRWLDLRMAERIGRAMPAEIELVGVFVNHSLEEIVDAVKYCRLSAVQLHGDESPDFAARVHETGVDVIGALRVDESNVASLPQELANYKGVPLKAALIDARAPGAYGGTGKTAPWPEIAAVWQCDWPPLLLAGGLTEANVEQAIRTAGPWGIDTAGGVESSPGIKDLAKVRRFIEAARRSV